MHVVYLSTFIVIQGVWRRMPRKDAEGSGRIVTLVLQRLLEGVFEQRSYKKEFHADWYCYRVLKLVHCGCLLPCVSRRRMCCQRIGLTHVYIVIFLYVYILPIILFYTQYICYPVFKFLTRKTIFLCKRNEISRLVRCKFFTHCCFNMMVLMMDRWK